MTDQNREHLEELLDFISNPNYRQRHQEGIAGPKGVRITDQKTDDTVIDENQNTRICSGNYHTILDCGHCSTHQVGGICHFCDALVCRDCIAICSGCGLAVCNTCSTEQSFDGQPRRYCRTCVEEISRSLRMKQVQKSILTFFFES